MTLKACNKPAAMLFGGIYTICEPSCMKGSAQMNIVVLEAMWYGSLAPHQATQCTAVSFVLLQSY